MEIKAGDRLASQACATEVIVVRGGAGAVVLTCGGLPMVTLGAAQAHAAAPMSGMDTGAVLGKRYHSPKDEGFEVLVTKPGAGTLDDGDMALQVKAAKPLPASD